MQIKQEGINVELPRAMVGGLKRSPVEDLLRRIAHDYAALERENRRLWETLERIDPNVTRPRDGRRVPAADETLAPTAGRPADGGVPGAPSEAASGEARGAEQARGPDGAPPHPARDPDELASVVLAVAHRAAQEMRESARSECELMLKKTRSHAEKLERDLEHALSSTSTELEQLQALKLEVREHMRSSLRGLLHTFVVERSGELPALDWTRQQSFVEFVPERPQDERRKKKKSKS